MNYIMVAVPEDRVLEVYGLLAGPPKSNGSVADDTWSHADIVRFYRESPAAMRGTLDELALNAGKPVTIQELEKAIGLRRDQIAGVMGAGGRRIHNRYGKGAWPIKAERNHETRELEYTMPAEVADAIRDAQR